MMKDKIDRLDPKVILEYPKGTLGNSLNGFLLSLLNKILGDLSQRRKLLFGV